MRAIHELDLVGNHMVAQLRSLSKLELLRSVNANCIRGFHSCLKRMISVRAAKTLSSLARADHFLSLTLRGILKVAASNLRQPPDTPMDRL
jgi:hypothetical protein